MVVQSVLQVLPPGGEHGGPDAQNEHQTAHGGGTLLGEVPGGAVLPDGLARLQPAKQRDQDLARDSGHAKGHDKAQYICHVGTPPGRLSLK